MVRGNLPSAEKGRESGFTLIELSIVLVLIGLIIGGVLKGQELIRSTRLKMTISQWDAVKAATMAFQDKYQALPGDYSQATTFIPSTDSIGNGDGVIGPGGQTTFQAGANSGEMRIFWQHLMRANLLSGPDVGTDGWRLQSKVSNRYFSPLQGTFGTRTAHWLRLSAGDTTAGAVGFTGLDAAEIDRKFDDGAPGAGTIQGADATSATAAGCRQSTTLYSGTTTDACILILELL